MRIRVLGSAAGGGFPQWNCGCPNCRGVRAGTVKATPRTQESVAISGDGEHWVLLNASPEIRQQIEGFPPLHPKKPRHSPIAALTGYTGPEHRASVLRAGFQYHVAKPVGMQELIGVVAILALNE